MQETIVLYPAPGIGHIVSMVELGKLPSRHHAHKFSITILLSAEASCSCALEALDRFWVAQLKEIADGLERSGQRFLWIVKRTPSEDELWQTDNNAGTFDLDSILPNGLLDRTKERGMVVRSRAPQVEVLCKESVGGFVTHSGWNSVLEAVVAGIPMIAWPLYAEQHMNRNVLVEDTKLAIGVEQRDDDGFVSGNEIEKIVRELMEGETGREIRERSWMMKEMAMSAKGEFGSSTKALAQLIETWKTEPLFE